jgi:hypothetical protein
MLPSGRLTYSPITNRNPLKLPNDARMVVWTITNVEEWTGGAGAGARGPGRGAPDRPGRHRTAGSSPRHPAANHQLQTRRPLSLSLRSPARERR